MATINTNFANLPAWLDSKEPPWAALEAGSRIGAQVMETVNRTRQLSLEAHRMQSKDDLDHKEFEMKAQEVGLINQERTAQIEATKSDMAQWQGFQDQLNSATTTEDLAAIETPSFRTTKYQQQANASIVGRSHILSQSATGKALASLDAKYDDVISFDPDAFGMLGQFRRYSPEWTSALNDWSDTAKAVRGRQAQEDYENKQRVLTEGRVAVQTARGEEQRMNIDERGLWGGYQRTLGGRAPNKDTFIRGSVHDIMAKDSENRKELLLRGKAAPAPMTYEEAVAHADSIWEKNIIGNKGEIKRVTTKAERDALPPGTQYIGPDGVTATKQ